MNIRRIKILLDKLCADIHFSDETDENKIASFETIEEIKKELNN